MNPAAPLPSCPHAQRVLRDAWVEMQMMQAFMRYAQPALHTALLMVVIMGAILHGQVSSAGLWVWSVAVTVIVLVRYRFIRLYQRTLSGVSGPRLQAFMVQCQWLWTLSAVAWGASMFLFFLKAAVYDQFLCLLILIGINSFAVGTLSSYLRGFYGFVDGLGFTILLSLVFQMAMVDGLPVSFNAAAMLVLVLLYWGAIRMSGRRVNQMQRSNLELQFDNAALIASLTEKSRAALEAVEVKNRFIASAAHDLRQPVLALDLYAGWLAAEPEYVSQIAPKIVQSTRAVHELFNSLFDLAGLQSDPLKANVQALELGDFLQDLEVQYAPFAQEQGLRLRTRAARALVWTDPVLLKRLVGNLLSNALKNTVSGGVLMALRRRRGAWCIEIWDTGVGIAEAHQQAIFREFYRVPRGGTEQGFGLGLAIVSRISQALGHPVGMASRDGRGSVFWVELADARPAAQP